MKKIILGLTALIALATTQFASAADTKLNAGGIGKPYYIAPGCEWKLNGTGVWGKEYGLVCNGVYAATRTPTSSNPSAPLTVTASAGHYVTTYSGTTPLSSVNEYDYAIYKGTASASCTTGWTKGPFTKDQANTAYGMNVYYKTCASPCSLSIQQDSTQQYNLLCR